MPSLTSVTVVERDGASQRSLANQPVAAQCVTVVRLPNPGDRRHPVGRVLDAVARADLALSDRLHAASESRPYACVRRPAVVDVCAFTDELAAALLRGEPEARLVTRVRAADLMVEHAPSAYLRLAFMTPTHLRVAGFDHLIPDATRLFRQAQERWAAVGWPDLPGFDPTRIAVMPERFFLREQRTEGNEGHRGWVGSVRFNLVPLNPDSRAAVWTLARFCEYRGMGGHTGYGMGRVRLLADGERWEPDGRLACWDKAAPRVADTTLGDLRLDKPRDVRSRLGPLALPLVARRLRLDRLLDQFGEAPPAGEQGADVARPLRLALMGRVIGPLWPLLRHRCASS